MVLTKHESFFEDLTAQQLTKLNLMHDDKLNGTVCTNRHNIMTALIDTTYTY